MLMRDYEEVKINDTPFDKNFAVEPYSTLLFFSWATKDQQPG